MLDTLKGYTMDIYKKMAYFDAYINNELGANWFHFKHKSAKEVFQVLKPLDWIILENIYEAFDKYIDVMEKETRETKSFSDNELVQQMKTFQDFVVWQMGFAKERC